MMVKLGKKIAKYRIFILALSFLLLIPSAWGYFHTRVNYDILSYLPSDLETMVGQDILKDDFGKGAFAMVVVEGMNTKQEAEVKQQIEGVDGVAEVIWYDSLVDVSVPMSVLPKNYEEVFNNDNATLMAVFFNGTTSEDSTLNAIEEIRDVTSKQVFLSGFSAIIEDTKNISGQEIPMYVLIAAILTIIILSLFMDSWIMPLFVMLSIGMAIIYNMGSNVFVGEISYITQALAAILQLAVTMDYAIFLYHSYQENKIRFPDDKERAMGHAISNTFSSVVGSSVTTIAGFIALCFMSFTLGLDLGIVMAKGVVFGVLTCVTVLPAFILTFDRAINKTAHKPIVPNLGGVSKFVMKHYKAFIVAFLIILAPALYGYSHTDVYYKLDETLPKTLDCRKSSEALKKNFDMNSTHMVLASADLAPKKAKAMLKEMNEVDGVEFSLGMDSLVGSAIPKEMLPSEVKDALSSGKYQLMLISSEYETASDEVNNQITELQKIVKKYDSSAMLIGEAPCTKDLITITDHDFKVVSMVSILAIFVIILLVFKSISIPIVLVSVIEFAIFINMGIPYYTHTTLPFIASVVIGTIQLGATVDYAILMTTRYKKERLLGKGKHNSIEIALSTSVNSIVMSALGFFAATIGVGVYSKIDMISSLCRLLSRGAIISMFVVVFILPSMLMVFDRFICWTTLDMRKANVHKEEKHHEE